jgi:DUF1680 family protein
VYCLETIDNGKTDFINTVMSSSSGRYEYRREMFGGTGIISARSSKGENLIFIPYYAWGNRGQSSMKVWLGVK